MSSHLADLTRDVDPDVISALHNIWTRDVASLTETVQHGLAALARHADEPLQDVLFAMFLQGLDCLAPTQEDAESDPEKWALAHALAAAMAILSEQQRTIQTLSGADSHG